MLTDDICRVTIYLQNDISIYDIYLEGGIRLQMRKEEPLTESYFYILLCLWQQPLHGYGIMQMTSQITGGRVVIGSGTMYGATGKMIKKQWIREIRSTDPADERRRLYELTEAGRKVLILEVERLKEQVESADSIMGMEV